MSDIATAKKQLKIKASATQRLAKEAKVYRQETTDLETRLAKLTADGAEEWDIKNATKMVEESKKMIVDVDTRLGKAVDELKSLVVSSSAKTEVGLSAEDVDLLKAEEVLKDAAV
ncbi:tubulin binding cofactor A [Agrocybe pediades]|nr:tubulin binding cofactor A [Agrocybe pediades]